MASKQILLCSNYFPPEKGAAPNRIFTLAQNLLKQGYTVHVVCPFPNYPTGRVFDGFKGNFYKKTREQGILIYRLWLWPSNSTHKLVRLFSMLSFSLSLSLFFLLKLTPKKIFIQYSPVFVGFTAVFWSWLLRKKTILNVSDLWPLAGLEMGLLNKGLYYTILEKMEQFCYKKSHLILGQSQEIITYIRKTKIQKELFCYRNFPDFTPPIYLNKKEGEKEIKLVYAGLLGVAQGLYKICSEIQLPMHVSLHLYGAGPETTLIKNIANKQIHYHGSVNREELHIRLQEYDIAFIPLVNRIYGSVPSKVFEYSRIGLPLLYYAGGEGGDLVNKNKLGWVIPVANNEALQQFINQLSLKVMSQFPKKMVQENAINAFSFEKQFQLLTKEIDLL